MSAEESLRRTAGNARRLRCDDEDTIAAGRCRQASVCSEAVAGLPVLLVAWRTARGALTKEARLDDRNAAPPESADR